MANAERILQVPCPTCRRRTAYAPNNPWRPFCSERCRSIDLGAWASERFRVPVGTDPGDNPGDAPGNDESLPRA